MKKKFLHSGIIVIFFMCTIFSGEVKAAECEYTEKIVECFNAVKNGTDKQIDPETDFMCPHFSNLEEMAYNIVLDGEFKKIDEISDEYLDALQANKDYYFGPDRKASFLRGIDEVTKFFTPGDYSSPLYYAYESLCNSANDASIFQKTLACLPNQTTSIGGAHSYLNDSLCIHFASTKMLVRRDTAIDILMLNKSQIKRDTQKKYVQEQRSKYDELVDLMSVNIGYLLRIAQKWLSKTKNPY